MFLKDRLEPNTFGAKTVRTTFKIYEKYNFIQFEIGLCPQKACVCYMRTLGDSIRVNSYFQLSTSNKKIRM